MKCADKQYGKELRNIEYIEDIYAKPYLNKNPYCEKCLVEGHIIPAVRVVHIEPHYGDINLFWDQKNWQSLCEEHYAQKKSLKAVKQPYMAKENK